MQTTLAPEFVGTPEGEAAQAILRKCVHCGFCTATCPTYQLLGDELDGPRGRIYQMKAVFEGETPTATTQLHLDRCLTCRNCESTCPSGVEYGALLDLGRKVVEDKVGRPVTQKVLRWLLKEGLNSPLFAPAMRLGQSVRPLMPEAIKAKIPARQKALTAPLQAHPRKVLMLAGCVQPAMAPNINTATMRVLDALKIQTLVAKDAGCCGAVKFHLNDQEAALKQMRRNIDAWWPFVIGKEVESIIMNASGCGVMVKDYGHLLAGDQDYADKAARISALTQDLSEYLAAQLQSAESAESVAALKTKLEANQGGRKKALPKLVYHPPCTLQHGQQLRGGVEGILRSLGFELELAGSESHLCCGSAGTYSVLQPLLSGQLKERKLQNLLATKPEIIVSANIGCITHLQSGTQTPVQHWIEVLDVAIS